jgi:biotin carboxylase
LILNKKNSVNTYDLTFPVVIKPLDANSSKGVTKVYDQNKIEQAIEYAASVSRSDKFIIEEYAPGREYSADVVIKDKKARVVMITENVKSQINSEHFIITQSLFNLETYKKYELVIKEIAEKISKSFCLDNITLLIQTIIREDEISVIEFSARIGGGSKYHFIKGITGFDILDFYLFPLLKKDVSNIPQNIAFKYGSVSYLYSHNCTFNRLEGASQLKENGVIADYFCYKTHGMCINNHTTSSDRPAGYMILDNNYRLFQEKHKEAKDRIKVFNDLNMNVKIDI